MTLSHVIILVEQGFVPTELALVQDVLRIANRLAQELRFDVRVRTLGAAPLIEGAGGMLVRAERFMLGDTSSPDPLPDHLVVLGGSGVRTRPDALKSCVRRLSLSGQSMILLSDAASAWKQIHAASDQITTHWEDHRLDCDTACTQPALLPLYIRRGRVTTAAGMASTADVVLDTIVAPLGARFAQSVANVLLISGIRSSDALQPRSENDISALRQFKLEPVIAAMEQHLDEPLGTTRLAVISGLSVRQLERKFKSCLGQTPAAFYRSLRMRRARTMIEQSDLHVTEIAVACGFANFTSFSKNYAREYGISPSKRRAQLAGQATPRPAPSRSQGSHNAPVPLSARSPRPSAHTPGADEAPLQGARG